MEMTPILIYYGYTYFGLPDIDEKIRGCVYSYGTLDDSDEKIDDSGRIRSQFQKSVPEVRSRSQSWGTPGLPIKKGTSSQ